jgi:uncharacterized phosphosugar-binding protein
MAPKKTTAPNGAVEKGDAAAAVALETAVRSNGADVAKAITLIDTSRTEAEHFAFERPHHPPIFGFGNAVDAANYYRLLCQHAVEYAMRRPTIDEAAQLRDRRLNVFTIADELAKLNPTRKAA